MSATTGVCHICSRPGHWARDCPDRKGGASSTKGGFRGGGFRGGGKGTSGRDYSPFKYRPSSYGSFKRGGGVEAKYSKLKKKATGEGAAYGKGLDESLQRMIQLSSDEDMMDIAFGFPKIDSGKPRTGYLLNVHPVTCYL